MAPYYEPILNSVLPPENGILVQFMDEVQQFQDWNQKKLELHKSYINPTGLTNIQEH